MTIPINLILVRGLPGVGKSTITSFLVHKKFMSVIDPDNISFFRCLFYRISHVNCLTRSTKNIKFRICLNMCKQALTNEVAVIWCQMFSSTYGIDYIFNFTKNLKLNISFKVLELYCDSPIAFQRCKYKKWMNLSKMEAYKKSFEELPNNANYSVYKINTNNTLPEVLNMIETINLFS